ncbi:NAD(P)H-dependent oxidoreductase [Parasphingorhabdus halotolerans]|uniref:Flavodoxin family protein n=1 Tax=Parasphingorhabdus halotolerans TaxID=2725558 RepID=A0A6H2DQN0_9SPHN|nr:NAD(P)H-dependent oxidoreductase [Parasphingorhabdus halotolerans]QJB70508.1 flavodoxin family protein [Parasphingorhabdus halotolerans]
MKRIAIIDGHPDPSPARFGHAIVAAYADAAREAGHEVREIRLAGKNIPMLESRKQWLEEDVPASVRPGQEAIKWAQHIVFYYPLWMGDMPALLKAFLEQAFRPNFALDYGEDGYAQMPKKLLRGRSARLIVTMGMPSLFYRAYFASHSVRSFKRNILKLTGVDPVTASLIGNVDGGASHRERWLKKIAEHGANGD